LDCDATVLSYPENGGSGCLQKPMDAAPVFDMCGVQEMPSLAHSVDARPATTQDQIGDTSRMYGPPRDCKGKSVKTRDMSAQMYSAFGGEQVSWP
jgi:hypothetical protein